MGGEVECPYCGTYLYIDHDDGYGYEEDVKHQQVCDSCEKTFTYLTTITYDYEAEKAECLNGGEHNYKPTRTFPKQYTKMECMACGDIRKPTDIEKKIYQIPQNDL